MSPPSLTLETQLSIDKTCVATVVVAKPISKAQNGDMHIFYAYTLPRKDGPFEPEKNPPKGPCANLEPLRSSKWAFGCLDGSLFVGLG